MCEGEIIVPLDPIEQHNQSLTLWELLEGRNALVFECTNCGRQQDLDLKALITEHGGETRVAYVKRNHTCNNCGR